MRNQISVELGNVYKDIMNIKIEPSTTFDESIEMFYNIMRKYGIKQGELSDNGISIYNAEWSMCWEIFKSVTINSFFVIHGMMKEIPNDLSHN